VTAIAYASIDYDGDGGVRGLLWSKDGTQLFVATPTGIATVNGTPPSPVGFQVGASATDCDVTLSWKECPDMHRPLEYHVNLTYAFNNGTTVNASHRFHFSDTDGAGKFTERSKSFFLPQASMVVPAVVQAQIFASNSHLVPSLMLRQVANAGSCMPTPAPSKPKDSKTFLIAVMCGVILSAAICVLAAQHTAKWYSRRRRKGSRPRSKEEMANVTDTDQHNEPPSAQGQSNGAQLNSADRAVMLGQPLLHGDDSDDSDDDVGQEIDDFLLMNESFNSIRDSILADPSDHQRSNSRGLSLNGGDERERERTVDRKKKSTKNKKHKAAGGKQTTRSRAPLQADTKQEQTVAPPPPQSVPVSPSSSSEKSMTLKYTIEQFSRRMKGLR
jgi:hypothetical protein